MADQQKPNPAPAPKSSNLGQQLNEQPMEESEKYDPTLAQERKYGQNIDTRIVTREQGGKERALAADRARAAQFSSETKANEEAAAEEEAAAQEAAAEEIAAENEQQEPSKNREEEVLKGGGLETGPSVQEKIRDELLKERAIAAAKENAGEQLEEEEQEQEIKTKNAKPLPTPDKLNNDRVLDAIMISVLATKDIVDWFDYIGFGALSAAFFLVIVIVLRSMQKTRTNKSRAMIFGIILFLDAIPGVAMLFPSSVVMLYFLRFEDMENKLKTITGPLKSGK